MNTDDPSALAMTVALWSGYLKAISVSRGPALLVFERDVRAMLELHDLAQNYFVIKET